MSKPLARIGQRFTSQFIDGLVPLAVGVVFYFIANAFGLSNEWIFVGWFLYILFATACREVKVWKRITKICVVHVDSELPCTYWQSFVRNFTMVLGVIDAAFIAGKQRRRLGSLIAGTKVIQL
ncbi:MAG: RDD family protein [Rhodoferax sp.]|nr:RDD family protein [Rhodoferax sp.]